MGSGGSFKGCCLLPRLKSLANHAFVNVVASIAALDTLVFSSLIVIDFLENLDEGRRLL